jgi:hypothetical protein
MPVTEAMASNPPEPPPPAAAAAAAVPDNQDEEDAAKKVVDCLRTEFRPDALLQNESTAVGKLRLIEQALREPGGLVLAPKDALRGRQCHSEQLGVKSGDGNPRKEAEKQFVHYCYLCSKFVVGKWQDHSGRAHVKRVQSMLWAAISCLDDTRLELVMKAAAEPQPMSSSDEEEEEDVDAVGAGRPTKRAWAAATADGGVGSDGAGAVASGAGAEEEGPVERRKRARLQSARSEEAGGDGAPEKRTQLQSVETEDEERLRLKNDVSNKYCTVRRGGRHPATAWNDAATTTYAYSDHVLPHVRFDFLCDVYGIPYVEGRCRKPNFASLIM